MKKIYLLTILFAMYGTVKAQVDIKTDGSKTKTMKELDSLILQKTSMVLNFNDELSVGATRGIPKDDPCDNVLTDLEDAFSSLKSIHRNCCRGETSFIATGLLLYNIYSLYNSGCDWEENPRLYAAALYYRLEYDTWQEKNYCGSDCDY